MKRRKFLTVAGIGGLIAGAMSFTAIETSFEDAAEKIIYREVGFLKLDADGVRKFAKEYGQQKDSNYRIAVRGYALLGIRSHQSGKISQLITAYMLSTDFFRNEMNETKVVRYIGLYNPYTRPCSHPFSHHYYRVETV